MNLSHLIEPTSLEEFTRDYWECKPLIVHRENPDHFAGLLALADMDGIMSVSSLRSTDVRVVSEGVETPISDLVGGEAAGFANGLEALYERYRQGATINLLFLHERWEPLAALCRSLSAELSCGVQTNVYLTPPGGSQALKPHYDTHDVFVLQMHGTKQWRLYDSPTELPLQSQPFRHDEYGEREPVQQFQLRPGDTAYLPRGTVHAATSDDQASLHLTIGVLPMLWATVLRSAVERALAGDVRFRRAFPLGFALDTVLQSAATVQARELIGVLADGLSAPDMIRDASRTARLTRQPVLHGHIVDLERERSIGLDTIVRRRPDLLWRLGRDHQAVYLEFHGKVIKMPLHVSDELQFVVNKDQFTPRDVPGDLDEAGRVTLVRKLVREGFLTVPF